MTIIKDYTMRIVVDKTIQIKTQLKQEQIPLDVWVYDYWATDIWATFKNFVLRIVRRI